ncbi:MAG TPA: SDR family NAD(P)-dependent oxidoreductase [Rectinemataceae bacterium]|nr:SDR family NAD(P)-dependent oxidoreductase [Rectinemataceae bacterium]
MTALNNVIIAPLVRGLFLDATELPLVVAPARSTKKKSGVSPIVLNLSQASLCADGALDEAKAAAELARAFGQATAGGNVSLPAIVEVTLGDDILSFKAANFAAGMGAASSSRATSGAAVLDAAAANSALGRAAVVAGKVALVTGGAQGFGAEIVRGLAASGAYVFIADLNLSGAASLSEELNAAAGSPRTSAIGVNVTDEASVAAMFDAIAAATGGLDLIVSNAGVLKASSVLDQDEKSFRFVTDVNYTGFFFMAKHGGRLLRRQWRAAPRWMTDIVQINSKSGLQGSNKNGAYAGSKFGSIGLVQSFALEFVQYGIKVNAICPGNFFDGPLWSDPVKGLFVQYLESGKVPGAKTIADVKAYYEAKVPMGRGTTGADVMRALYYLVEQEYETGQALPVTGGQVMLN